MPLSTQNPGRFDRRITLQYPAFTRNSIGEQITTWVNAGDVWAHWLPQGGREFRAAQSRHAEATGVFRIRHRTDVDQTWRLLHGDDYFEVIVPEEVGRRCYLDLIVRGLDQTPGSAVVVDAAVDAELLHDLTELNLHDGSLVLLHDANDVAATIEDLLEDGTPALLHDGSSILLEPAA